MIINFVDAFNTKKEMRISFACFGSILLRQLWPLISYAVCIENNILFSAILERLTWFQQNLLGIINT